MTRTPLALALALSLATLAPTPVRAATYNSSIVRASVGSYLMCMISNIGTKSINVSGSLIDGLGFPMVPSYDTCVSTHAGVLAPGKTCEINLAGVAIGRCSVESSSSKIRAVLAVFDSSYNMTLSVPATK